MRFFLGEKGNENKIEQNLNLDEIKAPVSKGQKVGQITYTLNGKVISSVDLITKMM